MIYFGNILEVNPDLYDEVWVICYSVESISSMFTEYKNVYHVPELGPSKELFRWYRKKVHDGEWNQEQFDRYYVPRFLEDIKINPKAEEKINNLINFGGDKNIFLGCFCEDEKICHRSILKEILFEKLESM